MGELNLCLRDNTEIKATSPRIMQPRIPTARRSLRSRFDQFEDAQDQFQYCSRYTLEEKEFFD